MRESIRGERGQMILVAGLLLAVLLVGLALVVNSAIYTENLSTREVEGSSEALADDPPTTERLTRSMREANYNSDTASYTERRSTIRQNVSSWNQQQAVSSARKGRLASSEVAAMQNGTRISQDTTREFMPAEEGLVENVTYESTNYRLDPLGISDRTNWLLAPDVQHRSFETTVQRDSLKTVDQSALGDLADLVDELLTGSDVFWVEFEDDETTWRTYVVEVEDTDEVATIVTEVESENGILDDVDDERLVGHCRISGESATVVFGANELRSSGTTVDCPELSFTNELSRHDIYYVGGDEVQGTYDLVVDKQESDLRTSVESEYETLIDDFLNHIADEEDDGLIGDLLDIVDDLSGPLTNLIDEPSEITSGDVLKDDPSDGEPYTTTAVYDTSVEMTYQTDRMRFTRNLTVAPESSGLS